MLCPNPWPIKTAAPKSSLWSVRLSCFFFVLGLNSIHLGTLIQTPQKRWWIGWQKSLFSWHFASELDWFLNIFDMEFWVCNKFLILYPQNNGASRFLELQLESHLPHVIPVLPTSGRTLEMWLFNSFRVAWSSAKRGVPWMLYPSYWCVYCFFIMIMFQFIFYMFFSNEICKRAGEKWSDWSDILHSFVAHLPRVG